MAYLSPSIRPIAPNRQPRRLTAAWLLGCACAVATPAALAADPVVRRATIEPDPLTPSLLDDETYAETFTVVADLKDGTYLQVQLATTNIGPGDGHGACRMILARPGAKPWRGGVKVDRDAWSSAPNPSNQLQVGPCRLSTSSSTTTLDLTLEEHTILLSLDAAAARVTPPGHPVLVDGPGGAFYESHILIPWARAHVTLADADADPIHLQGFGYADHSRSTTRPAQIARRWVRFRGLHGGACATLFLARMPRDGHDTPKAYWWRRATSQPEALGLVELQTQHGAGSDALPVIKVRIKVRSEEQAFAITANAEIYRHAPLEEFGLMGRLIGLWVGDAVTLTYRARLDSETPCQSVESSVEGSVEGILEITDVSK